MNRRWPCEETTFDFEIGDFIVRLWLNNPDGLQLERQFETFRSLVQAECSSGRSVGEIANGIALRLDTYHVNAIQVKRPYGYGHMIYTVPFTEGET